MMDLDKNLLSYISPGKYIFKIKRAKNVPVEGTDDKRQITATVAVSAVLHS